MVERGVLEAGGHHSGLFRVLYLGFKVKFQFRVWIWGLDVDKARILDIRLGLGI